MQARIGVQKTLYLHPMCVEICWLETMIWIMLVPAGQWNVDIY